MAKYPHVDIPVDVPEKKSSAVTVLPPLPEKEKSCSFSKKVEKRKEKRKEKKKVRKKKLMKLAVRKAIYTEFHSPKKAKQKRRELGTL